MKAPSAAVAANQNELQVLLTELEAQHAISQNALESSNARCESLKVKLAVANTHIESLTNELGALTNQLEHHLNHATAGRTGGMQQSFTPLSRSSYTLPAPFGLCLLGFGSLYSLWLYSLITVYKLSLWLLFRIGRQRDSKPSRGSHTSNARDISCRGQRTGAGAGAKCLNRHCQFLDTTSRLTAAIITVMLPVFAMHCDDCCAFVRFGESPVGQSTNGEGGASEAEVETRGMCLQCGKPVLNNQKRVKSELGYVHDMCMPSFQVTIHFSCCHSYALCSNNQLVWSFSSILHKALPCALSLFGHCEFANANPADCIFRTHHLRVSSPCSLSLCSLSLSAQFPISHRLFVLKFYF